MSSTISTGWRRSKRQRGMSNPNMSSPSLANCIDLLGPISSDVAGERPVYVPPIRSMALLNSSSLSSRPKIVVIKRAGTR